MNAQGVRSPETRTKIATAKRRLYEDPAEREKQRQRALARSHGHVGTGVYTSWYAMKRRVKKTQPHDVKYYRGLDMDPRWERFEAFLADMGERPEGHSLDRIDGSRGYWPDNCRWATFREQRLNQTRPAPRMADCHSDRRHCAKGLCRQCWDRQRHRAA